MLGHRVAGLLARTLLFAVVTNLLSACAISPSSGQAVKFVEEAEEERKRLTEAGFPQYTGGGD